MSFIDIYDVVGMTCDHCGRAVTAEVEALEGVTEVEVDVPTGKVQVTTERAVSIAVLRAAVEEAGYQLV